MRDASSSSSSRRLETSSERRDIVRRRSRGRAIESPVEGDVSDEVDISCNAGLDEAEEEDLLSETMRWIRCSPAELYYRRDEKNPGLVTGTEKLRALQEKFRHELVERAARAKSAQEPYNPPPRKSRLCNPKKHSVGSSETSDSSSNESDEDNAMEELEVKKKHPYRLHPELWFNDPGEMNDGPLCRCSAKAQRSGIRHGIYPGEEGLVPCDPNTNNADRLHHYCIAVTPRTNFSMKCPTSIRHDGRDRKSVV